MGADENVFHGIKEESKSDATEKRPERPGAARI
jgi:hypothetical protein